MKNIIAGFIYVYSIIFMLNRRKNKIPAENNYEIKSIHIYFTRIHIEFSSK